jgi:uroporphyrinogen-III decarboxylase
MFLLEEPAALQEIVDLLERSLAGLVSEVARLPGDLILSPDNLDGQFVPPESFDESLAPSYTRTAETLHAGGKRLVVHAGGPVRGLLAELARCGVDCVQGISGPPQGDSTLEEARELAGPRLALWGGIPQDTLLASCADQEFRAAAEAAFSRGAADPRVIVGVADRVPADALPERIQALARMALQA